MMSWETPSSAQGRKSVQKAEESPVAKLGGKLIVMKRTALLLLVALVAVLPTVGGPKDAPKEPAPKPLFALQLAADRRQGFLMADNKKLARGKATVLLQYGKAPK